MIVKKHLARSASVLLLLSLLVLPIVGIVSAENGSLEEQIEEAAANGLEWLAATQHDDGSWGGGNCDKVGRAGLVVLKFEDRAVDLRFDPLDPEYEYSAHVQAALDFIVGEARTRTIGVEPAGDPDGDGDGIGVYFSNCHEIYNTGIAMMALSSSGHPELYGDLVQDSIDFMAWAQADPGCGLHRGGWRYGSDYCDSDNSNAGYATLGLGFAEAPWPFGFELTVPQFVKDELSIWVDVMQDDVDGDANDGGSWYDPDWPGTWVNILKTGNLLYEMGLAGDTAESPRVQDAVDYIERHWYDGGGCGTGWTDHRQAMFTMMKGLTSLGIDYLDLDNDSVPETDWFEEVATHLIVTQNADGSWPGDCWGDPILSTAWALLTLEKAVPTFEIHVAVDIKPGSCPNPLNTGKKGVLPLAILGLEDFDVSEIDPASVQLEGVSPLRWSMEDVTTPFEPFIGKEDAYDCNEFGPDSYMDYPFKFDLQEIVAAIGDVEDGDVLILTLTGNLKEEFGGTPIIGEDVVKILKKGK